MTTSSKVTIALIYIRTSVRMQRTMRGILNAMLSSIEAVVAEVVCVDVATLSGTDAADAAQRLTIAINQLTAFRDACASRAVAANHHTVRGFANGAEYIAAKTGVSQATAKKQLAIQKSLAELPSLDAEVRSGSLSLEKVELLTRNPELLACASKSVEELRRDVQRKRVLVSREVLRREQYFSLHHDGTFVKGNFALLPENASWLASWAKRQRSALRLNRKTDQRLPDASASAEAFSNMVSESGGDTKGVVTYHVDVPLAQDKEPSCELVGVGPVPLSVVEEIQANAILNVILRANNKLAAYYENVLPDKDKPLPEPVKRAVKADAYDTCSIDGCFEIAVDVDHIQARCNDGDHELHNLQALCESHHDAKTKIDAPWTIAKFYGRKRELDPGPVGAGNHDGLGGKL
jgi:hypothetical protein